MWLSRRNFIKGAVGVGLGALGAATVWGNLGRVVGRDAAGDQNLPFYARPARFFSPMEGNVRCGDCHSEVDLSPLTYCHTEHTGDYVICRLCPKACMISEGQRGDCRVRENRGGTLYTMTYGNPCAMHVDPIEKKPLYHFLPGTQALSLSTAGCNLHCLYCQNYEISQRTPEEIIAQLSRSGVEAGVTRPVLPEELVATAQQTGSRSIAFTYGEPTVFYEYMYDTARLARAQGVRSVTISAGYIQPEPLRELCAVVDAIKIDLKGINEQFYEEVCSATLGPVLESIRTIAASGVHLEIVNLVVPRHNDDPADLRELAGWLYEAVGPEVPLHFTRFHPTYRLTNLPPTSLETLERAYEIAREVGLHYVYVGNVPGHSGNHTYCPQCGEIVVRRSGFSVLEVRLQEGACGFCGQEIPGVWR